MDQKPKRRRGAQPGNTNSLKHGLYSRSFRNIELSDLEQVSASLESEIALLRVTQARLFSMAGDFDQAAGQGDAIDVETAIKLLTALGATSTRIASLMRTQAILTGDDNQSLAALSVALQAVTKELGIQ